LGIPALLNSIRRTTGARWRQEHDEDYIDRLHEGDLN
jgi:hypothetical protein